MHILKYVEKPFSSRNQCILYKPHEIEEYHGVLSFDSQSVMSFPVLWFSWCIKTKISSRWLHHTVLPNHFMYMWVFNTYFFLNKENLNILWKCIKMYYIFYYFIYLFIKPLNPIKHTHTYIYEYIVVCMCIKYIYFYIYLFILNIFNLKDIY